MTNVLFVGRITPNKRIDNVIRHFNAYQRLFNPRSRLLLVGSYSGFDLYHGMLTELVARLGTSDVRFFGHVTNAELAACYEVADIFLCASEHEGSASRSSRRSARASRCSPTRPRPCRRRWTARACCTRRATRRTSPALIDQVATDRRLRDRIVEGQDAALARLLAHDFRQHGPRVRRARVASSPAETRACGRATTSGTRWRRSSGSRS